MEITLRCNAECPSCSRHCHYGMYGKESDVSMEQVERFREEIINHGGIDLVSVMGGEPTLHPNFEEIAVLVRDMKNDGHIKRCQIVTNGKIKINKIDGMIIDAITEDAEIRYNNNRCMFVSPYDTGQEIKENCPVLVDCGISWGAFGWWPCGAGGAICRLFGFNQFCSETIPENLIEQKKFWQACLHCQVKAKRYMYCKDYGDIRSRSFREAIRNFDSNKLWRY